MKSFKQFIKESPYLMDGNLGSPNYSGYHTDSAVKRMYDILMTKNVDGVDFLFVRLKADHGVIRVLTSSETDDTRFIIVGSLHMKSKMTFKSPYKNTVQVDRAHIESKYQGYGLFAYLYESLIHAGYVVASDATQFEPGKALWKRIARDSAGNGLKVRLFDGDDVLQYGGKDIIYDGSNVPDSLIWSTGQDYSGFNIVLIASK